MNILTRLYLVLKVHINKRSKYMFIFREYIVYIKPEGMLSVVIIQKYTKAGVMLKEEYTKIKQNQSILETYEDVTYLLDYIG